MSTLPTGTVTFLFTDIEGSTTLWQKYPDAMEIALARHHAILRQAIETHRGYVFQIVGDAFCTAFATATDGLAAALAAQRGLRDEAWGEIGALRVRMALHTGAAEVRAGEFTSGEYVSGITMSRAARLLSAGHGGQVLLSDATRTLVENDLPQGVTLRDLGEHRLKDLQRPEHIYQLVVPDLPADFPPLKTLDTLPNNLPVQLTSFIGREREMTQLKRLVQATRLVTLTGAGGSGKTRLALQTAANLLDDFKDGVWFVALAPLTNPTLIPSSVASILGVREQQAAAILDLLTDYLCQKQLLLILDNAEHLIEACAHFANGILQSAAKVHLLATSREALGIAGEHIFYVPSLQLPDARETPAVEILAQMESVRLFVERAVAVSPGFALTDANASAVAQICQRLDGIPLAIELAAARVKALSVEDIAKRLDDRFLLLTGGSRTALPRHQTLRALIDWSYNLLSEPERLLLHRLSVFAGGWTLEAAEEIGSGEDFPKSDILERLTHLVDKSLVTLDEPASRYRMLETIRQYARERLMDTDESAKVRYRHLDYFTMWSEEAELQLKGNRQGEWVEKMELESDNLRLALEWSQRSECDPEIGLRLLSAILRFWWMHDHFSEAKYWIERTLARKSSKRSHALSHVLSWAGIYLSVQPDQRDRAGALLEESLSIGRELGDKASICWALMMLGRVAEYQGDSVNAVVFEEQALQVSRELGERWYICFALDRLGEAARLAGDYPRAKIFYEEGLELASRMGTQSEIALFLHNLGHVLLQQGKLAEATTRFVSSLQLAREIGEERRIIMCLEGIASVLVQAGKLERAARLFGAAAKLRGILGADFEAADHVVYLRSITPLKGKEFEMALNEGRALTLEQAVAYALEEFNV